MNSGKSKKPNSWITTRTDQAIYNAAKERARAMRQNPTPAEDILWQHLRQKQINGYRFRRQHPIDRFIVDFYCRAAQLVIEVDGTVHDTPEQAEYDEERQLFLQEAGLQVLRFRNAQVINETDAVVQIIKDFLSIRHESS